MCPARIPPTTPPTSKSVDRVPAVESDKYWPSIAASWRRYHGLKMQVLLTTKLKRKQHSARKWI